MYSGKKKSVRGSEEPDVVEGDGRLINERTSPIWEVYRRK